MRYAKPGFLWTKSSSEFFDQAGEFLRRRADQVVRAQGHMKTGTTAGIEPALPLSQVVFSKTYGFAA